MRQVTAEEAEIVLSVLFEMKKNPRWASMNPDAQLGYENLQQKLTLVLLYPYEPEFTMFEATAIDNMLLARKAGKI